MQVTSVPLSQMIESLHLAKVPAIIMHAIGFTPLSQTVIKVTSIVINRHQLSTRTLQSNSLSLMIFVLAVNPLSVLLLKCHGYMLGYTEKNKINVTHTMF